MTQKYLKHPITPTKLGIQCLRARLSLRETQKEFAKRFQVQTCTVNNWETGKTQNINKVHQTMLDDLTEKLKREGTYIPADILTTIYREKLERKGNALQ
jgi:transcriptional regulator with XRE-family HTH domain